MRKQDALEVATLLIGHHEAKHLVLLAPPDEGQEARMEHLTKPTMSVCNDRLDYVPLHGNFLLKVLLVVEREGLNRHHLGFPENRHCGFVDRVSGQRCS